MQNNGLVMNCEELRLERDKTYVEYLNTPVSPEKMRLLGLWKSLCLQYEDAYLQEIKGEIPHDLSKIGSIEKQPKRIEKEGDIYIVGQVNGVDAEYNLTERFGKGQEPSTEEFIKMCSPIFYEYKTATEENTNN